MEAPEALAKDREPPPPDGIDAAMEGATVDENESYSFLPEHAPVETDMDIRTPEQRRAAEEADAHERARAIRALQAQSLRAQIALCDEEDLFARRDLERQLRELAG